MQEFDIKRYIYRFCLNWLNDIVVKGKCAECGRKVACIMEFCEKHDFFEKAMDFREALQN